MPVGQASSPWAVKLSEGTLSETYTPPPHVKQHQEEHVVLQAHQNASSLPVFAQQFSQTVLAFPPETLILCPSEVPPSTSFLLDGFFFFFCPRRIDFSPPRLSAPVTFSCTSVKATFLTDDTSSLPSSVSRNDKHHG